MIYLAWKNIIARPRAALLSILLVALSVGLMLYVLHVDKQTQQALEGNQAGVDLILSAKGSPLQTVLCNLYHIDNPTGNVRIGDVRAFFNEKHPLIKQAIPLSLGDSYRGHRIVGTVPEIADRYEAKIGEGRWWTSPLEIVAGAAVANKLGLSLGDDIQSNHGLQDDGLGHKHDQDLRIVGLLEETGTVIDHLLLTSYASIWMVHEHGASEPQGAHDLHDHEHGDHGHAHDHHVEIPPLLSDLDREITSVLIEHHKESHQTLNMVRAINENSPIMATRPAWELTRLHSLTGTASTLLSYLVYVIGAVAFISILFSLLQQLDERRYELALMRAMGGRPPQLISLVLAEGWIQVWMGFGLGVLFAHVGLWLTGELMSSAYRYAIEAFQLGAYEGYVLLIVTLLGLFASLYPAWLASRTDVSRTLQEG